MLPPASCFFCRTRWRVARPLDHSDAPNKVGAPLFAFCAKGGRDTACSADFDVAQIQYFK